MENPTILIALAAGMLSFFSPCVFPLVPAYVSYLTGSVVQNNRIEAQKSVLMYRSLFFILGFSVVFVIMGASASFIGPLFAGNRLLIARLAGLLIIVFGLQMAGVLSLRILMTNKQWSPDKFSTKKGSFGSFVLGLAFGTGWTPCVGLALSSILLLAGQSETLWNGVMMLLIYSLGLGIPFLVISLLLTYSLGFLKRINRFLPTISIVSGWILVALGILLFSGQFQKISAWLAQFQWINI